MQGAQIEVIPAIDIRHGKCVRLYQGDYKKETVFCENPVEVALRWQSMGAPRIHIVDLDGAAAGAVQNLDVIKTVAKAVKVPTQLGGGIRKLDTVKMLLDSGIKRVILGTVAVEDPNLVKESCRNFGEAIIVSLDAREGRLATWGWRKETELRAVEFAKEMVQLGVKRLIYTDITRDGTLTEPNFKAIAEFKEAVGTPVIAAGGFAKLEHVKRLKEIGIEGAIAGRALYTGDLDLKQAILAAK